MRKLIACLVLLAAMVPSAGAQVTGEWVIVTMDKFSKTNAPAPVKTQAKQQTMNALSCKRTEATVYSDDEYIKGGTNMVLSCYHRSMLKPHITDAHLANFQGTYRGPTKFNTAVLWVVSTDDPKKWLKDKGIVQREE